MALKVASTATSSNDSVPSAPASAVAVGKMHWARRSTGELFTQMAVPASAPGVSPVALTSTVPPAATVVGAT
ncbi:MAG: hypothetical protein DCC48_16765 [Acidobacteria bacterium]|nr:MAG: hypothetical protein DCC48_16765 [Acidobacteriota bacterium]